ncbi:MAG: helicase [Saprospiraceae bacterium]|nr:MAG: helicase [Saprospiraceae bacterium]
MQSLSSTYVNEVDVVYNFFEYSEELFLPTAYIVSRDKQGYLAHIQQKAMEGTIGAFGLELDPVRERLFTLIEELQPKALEKKFNPPRRKAKSLEELLEQKELKANILTYVHRRLDELLRAAVKHELPLAWDAERKVLVKDFVMEPVPLPLEPCLAFKRTENAVHYQLELKEGNKKWKISGREVIPITNQSAWIFADYKLYRIAHINGNMVKPFRQRDEVIIPKASVNTYFKKFILKVVAKVDIEAEGFEIVEHNQLLSCRLEPVKNIFDDNWVISLQMLYRHANFNWSDRKDLRTSLEMEEEDVRIIRVKRDFPAEKVFVGKLKKIGLVVETGSYFQLPEKHDDPFHILEWLSKHRDKLEQLGFDLAEPDEGSDDIYLFPPTIHLDVDQKNDWFDIYGLVKVGNFEIPFLKLSKNILEGNRLYTLPNGTLFLIPLEWMSKYRDLVQFAKKEQQHLRLTKSQFTILDNLDENAGAAITEELETVDYHPSPLLKAALRPYQLEGIKWLVQLYHNQLGACLADDMGLGKTLQTIALLLHAKEQRGQETKPEEKKEQKTGQLQLFAPAEDAEFLKALNALIVLPASLIFNWQEELNRFAPSLTVYKHIGAKRHKDIRILSRYDVILTTYQTALRDVSTLGQMEFEYIVLDESQQIKNRESKVFKGLNELEARHKISLSGTPIENSLSDLWSQMQFINPELLGSFGFFRKEFINPIEKFQDEAKKDRLRSLVKPYMLRRTKEEVAKDLPPLSTKLFFTEMTKEQKKLYEREKSAARNYLLDNYEVNNSQYKILVIQTLTKLRQLVNHPRLVYQDYEKQSGKFNDVLEHWEVIRKGGHKVLIFSSFVKYLDLFRQNFDDQNQAYSWLTGDLTQNKRREAIQKFNENPEVQSFLISIKTGGTGLNLTAADYVFILDPWWNPTTEQQAIARAHRIGQDKNVIAVKFITKGSIEEKILKLQDRKAQLAEDIIGNTGKLEFSKGDIEYLLD